ncbi:gamma-aminobutyric acid receptor subunit rho-2 [Folsomia candida]|uniref:gamma-aminobutyric acid receptor subunit rho-2 n=1 Tax=Folsomia candida TaxID=158441 RepID=UPI001604B3A5|nr:gamma-aminobutyric acid receptor subunit rho-2 [Folsomia candida]XP_035713858.1 gamma-aminobutyric acid receptor subunit rho-2 [Folsomia candida]
MPFSVEVLNLFLSFTALSIPGHALTSSPLISTSPYSPIHEICDENFTQHDNNLTNEEVTLSRREKLLCAFLLKHDVPPTSSESPSPKFEFNENFYLPKNYNKQAAPQIVTKISHPNGTQTQIKMPVPSLAYLNIRSVLDMNEEKEEVTLDLDLILMWIDGNIVRGLIEKNISVEKFNKFDVRQLRPMPLSFSEKVWTPDVFFEEVQSVRRPTVLDKTGQTLLFNPSFAAIFLRSRMLITLHCDMNFIYYPADSQKCQFHLRSDSYDSSQLSLRWWRNKAYGVYLHETSDPNFDYQVTNIREFESPTNLGPETRQGRTNCYLWFEIAMRRKMSYHLLQTYLPSVFFLIVTWLCFLIPTKLFEARVGVAAHTDVNVFLD